MQGLTRTLHGPILKDLADQVKVEVSDFGLVYLIGTFTFPLGNIIGSIALRIESEMTYYSRINF